MPTVTSDCSNPVTDFEKVMVASKGPACVADGPLMVTDGSSTAAFTENCVAARLPLLSESTATFAATSTVTVPLPLGATYNKALDAE